MIMVVMVSLLWRQQASFMRMMFVFVSYFVQVPGSEFVHTLPEFHITHSLFGQSSTDE
jgi:hypothetical protein